MQSEAEIIELLKARGENLSVAESVTGGALAKRITDVEGASHVFLGGIIAYSVESKLHDLDVPKDLIEKYSVYSEETAISMAEGSKRRFGSDWAIATTGVAGPGSSHGISPGSVWIAILGAERREVLRLDLKGNRDSIRSGAVESALSAFARILST